MAALFDLDSPYSINRNRDIIAKAALHGIYMLIAIENQTTIGPHMPLRVLVYDTLSYHQQYRRYQSSKRNNSKVVLKLLPVHTIVIYYGDALYKGPKSLLEMMKIPKEIIKKLNNWRIDIVDIKELDYDKLRDRENYDFIKYLQQLYRWNGKLEKLSDMVVSRNVAILLAAIAGNKKILDIIKKTKGETIDMCRSIDLFEAQALKNGTLSTLLKQFQAKLGSLSPQTKNNIENCSIEKLDQLTLSIFDITSEDDINIILND